MKSFYTALLFLFFFIISGFNYSYANPPVLGGHPSWVQSSQVGVYVGHRVVYEDDQHGYIADEVDLLFEFLPPITPNAPSLYYSYQTDSYITPEQFQAKVLPLIPIGVRIGVIVLGGTWSAVSEYIDSRSFSRAGVQFINSALVGGVAMASIRAASLTGRALFFASDAVLIMGNSTIVNSLGGPNQHSVRVDNDFSRDTIDVRINRDFVIYGRVVQVDGFNSEGRAYVTLREECVNGDRSRHCSGR
jgi:hypothetical protein